MATTKTRPAKTAPTFAAGRARQHIATRFNPIRGLTPAKLARMLEDFDAGYMRDIAIAWQRMLERDDQLLTVHPKRVRATSRLPWQILPVDDSPEAGRHKEALEEFYNNLTVTSALDEDDRGGVRLLVKQMLSSVAMRYAVHEIVWQPVPGSLTAEFRFVPLEFFERRSGRLRFLATEGALDGTDLEPGGWMITKGDGLMIGGCVAYMFKTMPLRAWVGFCEKFGTPGLHGKTSAAKDSAEWTALADALEAFGENLALITNDGVSLNPIELKNAGGNPHPLLVDRMDRAISRVWLGDDLSTMSRGQDAVGTNAQLKGADAITEDDAATVSETLQQYVDTPVLRMRFGAEKPLAYFSITLPKSDTTDQTIKRIETAQKFGVDLSKAFVRQELNLPEPDESDELIEDPPAPPSPFGAPSPARQPFGNDAGTDAAFRASALRDLAKAQAMANAALRTRFEEALGIDDDQERSSALMKLKQDLPRMLRAHPELVAAWENIFGSAIVSGATEAAAAKITA